MSLEAINESKASVRLTLPVYLASLIILMHSGLSCGPDLPSGGTPCSPDGVCPEGYVCINDVCVEESAVDPCDLTPNVGCPCENSWDCTDDGTLCIEAVCGADGFCALLELNDQSSCGESSFCVTGECVRGCLIAGVFYAPSDANPQSACLVCDPDLDAFGWTVDCPDGEACEDGVCVPGGGADGCNIDGTTHLDGAINPDNACEHCDSTVSTTDWSPRPAGTPCEEGGACDGAGVCLPPGPGDDCTIDGQGYSEGAVNPDNACEHCDSTVSTTDWSPRPAGTTCEEGGACDGAGVCVPPGPGDDCTIDGQGYSDGTVNSANPCEWCDSTVSTTSWSPRPNGQECGSSTCDNWSGCDVECGTGSRSRNCVSHICENGVCVSDHYTETESCTGPGCPSTSCDGWSNCSVQCGQGTQTRTCTSYSCTSGSCVSSTYQDTQGCDAGSCPSGYYCHEGTCHPSACVPNCPDNFCGPDDCGGMCSCPSSQPHCCPPESGYLCVPADGMCPI